MADGAQDEQALLEEQMQLENELRMLQAQYSDLRSQKPSASESQANGQAAGGAVGGALDLEEEMRTHEELQREYEELLRQAAAGGMPESPNPDTHADMHSVPAVDISMGEGHEESQDLAWASFDDYDKLLKHKMALDAKIGKLKAELSNQRAQHDEDLQLLQDEFEALRNERSEQMEEMEDELASTREELEHTRHELKLAKKAAEMASSGTSGGQEEYLQDTLREVEGRLEAVLAEVKKSSAEHQAEITALRQESDRTIAELTNEVSELNKENESLNAKLDVAQRSRSKLQRSDSTGSRKSPRRQLSPQPRAKSPNRVPAGATEDIRALRTALKSLEEENHWLQRQLAGVRERERERDPDYDKRAPALEPEFQGMGRWTQQRALDRKDAAEMEDIQEYLRNTGLPPEANGWQQLRVLWRNKQTLESKLKEEEKVMRALKKDLAAMEQLVRSHDNETSKKAISALRSDCRALQARVNELERDNQAKAAQLESALEAAGEADRLQEELDTLHREMDQAEKEHAHEIEDLLEAEKRLRREVHEKDHMLHSADEETAAMLARLQEDKGQLEIELISARRDMERLNQAVEDKHEELVQFKEQFDHELAVLQETLEQKAAQDRAEAHREQERYEAEIHELLTDKETLLHDLADANFKIHAMEEMLEGREEELATVLVEAADERDMLHHSIRREQATKDLDKEYAELEREQERNRFERRVRDLQDELDRALGQVEDLRSRQMGAAADGMGQMADLQRRHASAIQELTQQFEVEHEQHRADMDQARLRQARELKEVLEEKNKALERAKDLQMALDAAHTELDDMREALESYQIHGGPTEALNQSTRDMQLAHAGANIATLQGRLDDEQRRREDAEAMARAASVRGEDLQESVQAAQKALRTIHEMVGNTYRDFQKVGYNPLDDSSVHHVPTNAADQLRGMTKLFQNAQEKIRQADDRVRQAEREVQLVEEQVDTLKAERARLEDKIRDLDRQLSKANAAVADGQSRINNVLDTVRDGYGREKDTLLRKMQTDSEKAAAVEMEALELNHLLRSKDQQIHELEGKLRDSENSHRTAMTAMRGERHKREDAETQATTLREEIAAKAGQLADLQAEVAKATSSRRMAEDELAVKVDECAALERELTQCKQDLRQAMVDKHNAELAKAEAELAAGHIEERAKEATAYADAIREGLAQEVKDKEDAQSRLAKMAVQLQQAEDTAAVLQAEQAAAAEEVAAARQAQKDLLQAQDELNNIQDTHEAERRQLREAGLAEKARLAQEKRAAEARAEQLEEQLRAAEAQAKRAEQAAAALEEEILGLRRQHDQAAGGDGQTAATGEASRRELLRAEAKLKEKERLIAKLKQENATLMEDLAVIREKRRGQEERHKLEHTRLTEDVQRQLDEQSHTLRDLERIRGDNAQAAKRDYDRKLRTLTGQLRTLNTSVNLGTPGRLYSPAPGLRTGGNLSSTTADPALATTARFDQLASSPQLTVSQ